MSFKVGDIVRCIEKDRNELVHNEITFGKKYEVLSFNESYIRIIGDKGNYVGVYSKRFNSASTKELIEESNNKELGIRLQKAESIIKEYIEYKRRHKQQWSHELQKYVEEYCDISFIKEE